MMTRFVPLATATALLFCSASAFCAQVLDDQPEYAGAKVAQFTIGPIHVDKKYAAMSGPTKSEAITLAEPSTEGAKLWVKSLYVEVTDANNTPQDVKYLSYANLVQNPNLKGTKNNYSGLNHFLEDKMALAVDPPIPSVQMPEGHAMTVPREKLNAYISATANNDEENLNKDFYYHFTVRYLDDEGAKKFGLKPLTSIVVFVPFTEANADCALAGCPKYKNIHGGKGSAQDRSLFYVEPGRHTQETAIEKVGVFKNGGTINKIGMSMHLYGESISLVDKTDGKTLWTGKVKNDLQKKVVAATEKYSSKEGIRINPAHDYKIVSVYNNVTDKPITAMARLRMYFAQ